MERAIRDCLIVMMSCAIAVFLIPISEENLLFFSRSVQIVCLIVAATFSYASIRKYSISSLQGKILFLLFGTYSFQVITACFRFYNEVVLGKLPSLVDPVLAIRQGAMYAFLLLGVLIGGPFLRKTMKAPSKSMIALPAAFLVISVAGCAVAFLNGVHLGSFSELFFFLVMPVGMNAGLWILCSFTASFEGGKLQRPWLLLALGIFTQLSGDLAFNLTTRMGVYSVGSAIDLVQIAGYLLGIYAVSKFISVIENIESQPFF
ncbi:MAG: hypothetical protein V1820_02400 [archaeon]